MNSLIVSAVMAFVRTFIGKFSESRLWGIINNINNACKKAWKNSVIMGFLKKDNRSPADSIAGKVVFFPFTVTEILRDKLGEKLDSGIKNSVICELGRTYVHNFMALNTRFLGVMLLCASAVYNAAHFAGGMGISKPVLIISVIAAVFALVNFNVTGFFQGSVAVDFAKACAGVKNISFEFFDEDKTEGRLRFIPSVAAGILTGVVLSINPLFGLLVPFALFGMLLVLEYPVTGVYAAVFVAPLLSFSSMPLAGICIWTLLSLVLQSVYDKNFRWKREGVGFALLVFLFVMFVSCVFSFARVSSLTVWAMYFVFITFYFAVINTISTRVQIYGLLRLFVISGTLVALYGIMQYVFGWTTTNAWIDEEMFEDETMRVFSTLGNPNVLGEYLLLVLPPAVVFFLKDKAKSLSKWVYLAMTGIIFLCLILTQSRGCWLGFMLSAVVFITFYEGRLWAIVPLVICILPFVIPQTMIERFTSIGNMEDSSTSYRVFIYMGALGMLRHYIAGGIGMGEAAFNEVYPFFSYNAIVAPHSHNTFLQLLVEGGIPAIAAFVAVIAVFLRCVQNTYKKRDKKSFNSSMCLALGAGVCGFLLQSMFDYTFYNYRVMAVFFMVMGMAVSMRYATGSISINRPSE